MFEAEFLGKLPELNNREDYLTSCVFGSLKYLSPTDVFYPFISRSYNYFSKKNLSVYIESLGVQFSDFPTVRTFFWPNSRMYGEPDLVFILESTAQQFLLAVEVKFFAEKHGEEENDQLVRYYKALATVEGRKSFSEEGIRNCKGELLALIYLTQFEAENEIQQSLQVLQEQGFRAHDKFFHLRWQELIGIVSHLATSGNDPHKKAIYEDLMQLLRFKNLVPFSGFSGLPEKILGDTLVRLPIFFELSNAERKPFSGFPNLPVNFAKILSISSGHAFFNENITENI